VAVLRAPEPWLLVLADVSGYTSYLAGTELDHAQDVLSDLIDVITGALEPPLELLSVEGDACFLAAPGTTVGGQQLLDSFDACYFAFRRRVRDIAHATSCRCDACSRIPQLDLKFVAHHGQAVRQRVGRQENLTGASVIVVHRLLKNGIADRLGHRGYAFFSMECAVALGLTCADMGMLAHAEETDVGRIEGYVADMAARWDADERRVDRRLQAADVEAELDVDVAAPPAVVWDWLTSPRKRPLWQTGVTGIRMTSTSGRMEEGATNHCIHGQDAVLERILEWRPFASVTDRSTIPGVLELTTAFELEPTEHGTHVTFRAGGLATPHDRAAWAQMGPHLRDGLAADLVRMAELAAASMARGSPADGPPDGGDVADGATPRPSA
jgi:uncharacterized protein YndB with AHSA1/START domain